MIGTGSPQSGEGAADGGGESKRRNTSAVPVGLVFGQDGRRDGLHGQDGQGGRRITGQRESFFPGAVSGCVLMLAELQKIVDIQGFCLNFIQCPKRWWSMKSI
jgi:hypothetical protein